MIEDVQENLRTWFHINKRDFPWRKEREPYRVWISEVMLQQTQADRVIPYFYRWMEKFPDIHTLSNANIEDILKIWEGLGYYSRARQIHKAAKIIAKDLLGLFPNTYEDLIKIPGLGPYTASAVLAFAFQKRSLAIDANVMRVLARFFHIEDDIQKTKTRTVIQALGEKWLTHTMPWEIAEALIELGATVCTKKARCIECPLQRDCLAFQKGSHEILPKKSKIYTRTSLFQELACICQDKYVLVRTVPEGEIFAGLAMFPVFACEKDGMAIERLFEQISHFSGKRPTLLHRLATHSHSFTKYHATLYPKIWKTAYFTPQPEYTWVDMHSLSKLTFCSGHRSLLKPLCDYFGIFPKV